MVQPIEILISGDTAGWITPCGCAANQSGGLSRRATLLESYGEASQIVYLDAGGSASGTTEYQQMKLQAVLGGMQAMNLAAHNIGGPESALDPVELGRLAEKTGVVWLSANLQPAVGDFPVKRYVVISRNGVRFAVTGVVDPTLVANGAWSAREPVGAVLETLRDAKADIHLVLAYFDEAGLRSLAQSLPEVDFIVGGPTGQAMKPTAIGPVSVLSGTNKGKFLARIQLSCGGDGTCHATMIGPAEVTSNLAEDAQQVENLHRYYAALSKRDFTVNEAGLVSTFQGGGADRIAGSETCTKCHANDAESWHASRHSHAWDALVARQAHVDPFCQQCHTTGYGYDGGFVSVAQTPRLVHVGCENCHGPSAAHVANSKVKTPFLAGEQCIRCHDHENSPQFAYESYWPKIRHGPPEAGKLSGNTRTDIRAKAVQR